MMSAGLNVLDAPSLAGKAFNQVTEDSTMDCVMSLVMRLYGMLWQEHLTRSLTV